MPGQQRQIRGNKAKICRASESGNPGVQCCRCFPIGKLELEDSGKIAERYTPCTYYIWRRYAICVQCINRTSTGCADRIWEWKKKKKKKKKRKANGVKHYNLGYKDYFTGSGGNVIITMLPLMLCSNEPYTLDSMALIKLF